MVHNIEKYENVCDKNKNVAINAYFIIISRQSVIYIAWLSKPFLSALKNSSPDHPIALCITLPTQPETHLCSERVQKPEESFSGRGRLGGGGGGDIDLACTCVIAKSACRWIPFLPQPLALDAAGSVVRRQSKKAERRSRRASSYHSGCKYLSIWSPVSLPFEKTCRNILG